MARSSKTERGGGPWWLVVGLAVLGAVAAQGSGCAEGAAPPCTSSSECPTGNICQGGLCVDDRIKAPPGTPLDGGDGGGGEETDGGVPIEPGVDMGRDPDPVDMGPGPLRDLPPPGIVAQSGEVGWFSSLALDDQGRPHISFADKSKRALFYASWGGRRWELTKIDEAGANADLIASSLAIGPDGQPQRAYIAGGELRYAARRSSGRWETSVVAMADTIVRPALALDGQGVPHIVYHDPVARDLLHVRWTGTAWAPISLASQGDVGRYLSLALDDRDRPHVAFYDATAMSLRYVWLLNGIPQIETIDDTSHVGYYPSLALDAQGRPHVSYYGVSGKSLRYGHRTQEGWQLEAVEQRSGLVTGQFSSLALDDEQAPHILYYQLTEGDLRYAHRAPQESAWAFRTLDATRDVGQHLSFALDDRGRLHVSYLDASNGDLKYLVTK